MTQSPSTPSVIVNYELKLPDGVQLATNLQSSRSLTFPVRSSTNLYSSLKDSINNAKAALGLELTEWRDVVGTAENFKESRKASKKEDEDENENENDNGDLEE